MTRAQRLLCPSPDERLRALREVVADSSWTADELAAVIECLGDERKAVQRRAAEAAAQRARIDPTVAERLHEVVTASPWRQRWGAAFALSLLGPLHAMALPTLLEALDSDDGDVRWAAADLLKQLAARESMAVSAALLQSARDGTANQRKMALYCLRDLDVSDAAPVATEALAAGPIEVRLAALAALVPLARDKAAAARHVKELVTDADLRMGRAAAIALGQLGVATDDVRAVLDGALTAGDPSLRRAAERALRLLGPQR